MANDSKGWISLHRSIADNFLWQEKPFSKGQAWIDLLLLANHEEKKILYQGTLVTFQRGTVNRSVLSLAERWGWDRKKVNRFLKVLESDGMVTTNATTHGTTITLVNYGLYQCHGTTDGTAIGTSDGQPMGNHSPQTIMINNDNNDNKEIKASSQKHKYGAHNNVLLTDQELQKLKEDFPDWESKIEELSEGLALKGYKYKSHYLAIRKWARTDSKPQKGVSKYGNNPEQSKGYIEEDIFGVS